MVVVFEVAGPWQWRPGRYASGLMVRWWWGPFAVAWFRVPFREFCETEMTWEE